MFRLRYSLSTLLVLCLSVGCLAGLLARDVLRERRMQQFDVLLSSSDEKALAAFLDEHPDLVNRRPRRGRTPLYTASEYGTAGTVRLLIRRGVDVRARDQEGVTALHGAAANRDHGVDIAKLLIAEGADVNARAYDGETPLMRAAATSNSTGLAELLLEAGADIDAVDSDGLSAATYAVIWGDDAVAEFLASRGARLDIHSASALGRAERVAQLLREDPSCHRRTITWSKVTPLHLAAARGRAGVVRVLAAAGAHPNARMAYSGMPLHGAAEAAVPDVDTVRALIQAGASVNGRDSDRKTPLHHACKLGHLAVARLLIESGAEPDARDDRGRTPLFIAAEEGRGVVARLLVDSGADPKVSTTWSEDTPLKEAIGRGDLDMAKLLVAAGADVREATNDGRTALHLAAAHGDLEAVKDFIGKGAPITSTYGRTPLDTAIAAGQDDVAKLLREKGAE